MYKIQLAKANNFISSIYKDEEGVMHSRSDNTEMMKQMKLQKIFLKQSEIDMKLIQNR